MIKTTLRAALALVALTSAGCLFGGGPRPTLQMEPVADPGEIAIELRSSSIEPDLVALKFVVVNNSDRPLVIDRRLFVLTDGSAEWGADVGSRFTTNVAPRKKSRTLRFNYPGADGTKPSYELLFRDRCFCWDSAEGDAIRMAPLRLTRIDPPVDEPDAQ